MATHRSVHAPHPEEETAVQGSGCTSAPTAHGYHHVARQSRQGKAHAAPGQDHRSGAVPAPVAAREQRVLRGVGWRAEQKTTH